MIFDKYEFDDVWWFFVFITVMVIDMFYDYSIIIFLMHLMRSLLRRPSNKIVCKSWRNYTKAWTYQLFPLRVSGSASGHANLWALTIITRNCSYQCVCKYVCLPACLSVWFCLPAWVAVFLPACLPACLCSYACMQKGNTSKDCFMGNCYGMLQESRKAYQSMVEIRI